MLEHAQATSYMQASPCHLFVNGYNSNVGIIYCTTAMAAMEMGAMQQLPETD